MGHEEENSAKKEIFGRLAYLDEKPTDVLGCPIVEAATGKSGR
jgi:hypothetical protein